MGERRRLAIPGEGDVIDPPEVRGGLIERRLREQLTRESYFEHMIQLIPQDR